MRARVKFAALRRRTNTCTLNKSLRRNEPNASESRKLVAECWISSTSRAGAGTRGEKEQHSNIMMGSEHFNALI